MMIRAALRDLQARRRRFAVAIVGAGLVLALAMVMSGLTASFANEARRTVTLAGADTWVVAAGAAGPFTTTSLLDGDAVDAVRRQPGVQAAQPVLLTRQTTVAAGTAVFSIVVGAVVGTLGSPAVRSGRSLKAPGEVVVDRRLGVPLGATVVVAGRSFTVVGLVRSTLFAATPTLYVTLGDARQLSVGGAPLASAVLVRGVPVAVPPGLKSLTRSQAVDDAMEPLTSANATIALVRTLLWLVAALGVASVLYLNALERTRDMAVFKATGSSARSVAAGVVVQALFVAAAAAAVGCAVAVLLAPRFPMPAEIPLGAYLSLPVVALVVALAGSAGGVRRALVVPPALAFGAQ